MSLAEQLGFEIREEKGDFNGGWCRVQEDRFIFINRQHTRQKKISVLLQTLAKQPHQGLYILPAVRELLEETVKEVNNEPAPPRTKQ